MDEGRKKIEPDGTMQLNDHRQTTLTSSKFTDADHKFLLESNNK